MALTAQSILTRSDRTFSEIVAGEAVLTDVNSGNYISLNTVGTEFWQLIDGAATLQQHAEAIAQAYDVAAPMVLDDLLPLAEQMLAEGILLLK